jgi:hypothetical protein
VIRVVLPTHLRTLAGVTGSEVSVEAGDEPSIESVLDALEADYPNLRGAIRDYGTLRRRPFVRFFACEEDLSHVPTSELLPEEVVLGKEPFVVVGAMAGG